MIDRIEVDLKQAMLGRDHDRVSLLRMLKSALHNKRIELRQDLDEQQILQVLRTEAKQRQEAAELYRQGGNQAAADKEDKERTMIESYLPAQLDDQQLQELIGQVKADLGAAASTGALIQETLKRAAGKADGKRVAQSINS